MPWTLKIGGSLSHEYIGKTKQEVRSSLCLFDQSAVAVGRYKIVKVKLVEVKPSTTGAGE